MHIYYDRKKIRGGGSIDDHTIKIFHADTRIDVGRPEKLKIYFAWP